MKSIFSKSIFSIFFLQSFSVFADGGMCLVNTTNTQAEINKLQSTSQFFIKQAQVLHAQSDMGDFCRRNLIMRYLNSVKKAPANCINLPMSDLEKLADQTYKSNSPWSDALVSTRKSRLLASAGGFDRQLEKKETDTNQTRQKLSLLFRDNPSKETAFSAKMFAFCATENILEILKCQNALEFLGTNGMPNRAFLMTPNAWKLIYESNKFNKGIEETAIKLDNYIKNNTASVSLNIWDDLVNSFKNSGLNQNQAEEGAWSTLAIISNGGQNTESRVNIVEPSAKSSQLSYIARAMTTLDYLKQEKGLPLYSYPSNVKINCDSAKPYHFWMSAYLSRELAKEKIVNSDEAIKYSYMLERGYQLNRAFGRSSGEDLKNNKITTNALNAETYGPIHQVIRMDLAYAAGGAVFGARSVQTKSDKQVDVNSAIISLLQKSNPNSKENAESIFSELKTSELKTLSVFNNEFVPESALDSLLLNDK